MTPAQRKRKAREMVDGESPRTREMVAFWREYCPKMYRRLKRKGIVREFAVEREEAYIDLKRKRIHQGINWDDAGREASAELLMEPEEEETTI